MATPKVSVIIITYNRAALLRLAIESVLQQSLRDFELLIIDDGSADDTPAIVKSFDDSRIQYFGLDHTGHISKVRNFGLKNAAGQYVAFLDSDDLWERNKLAEQVRILDDRQDIGFVFCDVEIFDQNRTIKRGIYSDRGEDRLSENLFLEIIKNEITVYPSSTILFRKTCLGKTGEFDEELLAGEHDFLTRLAYHCKGVIQPLPLVRIRRHEGNTSAQIEVQNYLEVIHTLHRCFTTGAIGRREYDKMLLEWRYKLGRVFWNHGDFESAGEEFWLCCKSSPFFARAWVRYAGSVLMRNNRPGR